MIEILPLKDKILQESACLRCGVKYSPDLMAYAAYSDGSIYGICQFSIDEFGATIVDLANATSIDGDQTLFVIARAVLNFIDLCGVRFPKCKSKNIDESLIQRIGFSKNSDGIYEIDLMGFL